MKRINVKIIALFFLVSIILGASTAFGASKNAPVELRIEVFERALPGYQADNNYWTKWIQKNFGDPNNITVKFIPVPRSQEIDKLNILMASNDAPDIVFAYDLFTVYNYVRYGGLTDLKSPLNKYGKDLKKYLGKDLLQLGVFDGVQYTIPAKRALYGALNGFIRKDWLDKLGLPMPKTTQEWYNAMKAFKEKDPGGLGDRCIPYGLMIDTNNITWGSQTILDSFRKKMSKLDAQVLPWWLMPGYKDGMRFMNKLYNEGLITPEFALHKDDSIYNKDIQQGRVGYFIRNFDEAYRINPGLLTELKKNVPGANLVPCDPFVTSQGKHIKRVYGQNGFYMMVPKSSKRVAEAIKYLNWMAQPEVRDFLVNGEKGIHYKEFREGVPVNILVEGDKRLTQDIAIIVNGKDYGDQEKNIIAGAFGAPGYEKEWIDAYKMSLVGEQYVLPQFPIESEAKLKKSLNEKETELFIKSIVAKPADFDRTYDGLVQEYMNLGGKQVMEDRKAYLTKGKK